MTPLQEDKKKKKKKTNEKMGKSLDQTILQGGHTKGPETYEKMLSLTSHQRDAN